MISDKNLISLSGAPWVVGTVHSRASLAAAQRLRADNLDFVELRIDAFATQTDWLLRRVEKIRAPLIVTVRDFAEGGVVAMPAQRRRELFMEFLPHAAAIDVELQSARVLESVVTAARELKLRVIMSHHDFQQTPSAKKLRELARCAALAGADIFKVAATANHARDVATLLDFLTGETGLAFSVMGMGGFGKISRLVFAACGSVLNYGFLHSPNADGQWPAKLLKMRIAEVCTPAIRTTKSKMSAP